MLTVTSFVWRTQSHLSCFYIFLFRGQPSYKYINTNIYIHTIVGEHIYIVHKQVWLNTEIYVLIHYVFYVLNIFG